jgi:hypothetical protein
MIKRLNWLTNDNMTCAPNWVKNFNKLMQINKCLSFKQIMFEIVFFVFLLKYKKYNLKNVYIYTTVTNSSNV